MSSDLLIELPRLDAAMRRLVRGFGSSEEEVEAVASNLIEANLCGHDSHGIGMLPRYAQAYLQGGLVPNRHVRTLLDAGSLLRLDGGAGFGQVIGREAMALGIERAHASGSCILGLGNSHHLGRIGAWAEQAAAAGLVSLHFVNVVSRPIVAPHGGGDARFGTNPFCAGVPLSGREPVIVDFATSVIAQGKTRVAHNKGESVAPDCLIDDQGRATQDPRFTVVPPFGALLTVGAHKGYGLALLCELLGGALAAGLTQGPEDGTNKRVLNGMFSVLVDPAALADRAAFEQEAQRFIDWVRASPPREGFEAVQLAGEAERAWKKRRSAEGVPVDATTWDEILGAAESLGVDPKSIQRDAGLA
ncbi:MAG: malate/lactate/ureidoglycolate dehydrogenase [Burkholderiales bacterium]|nr:malate/lactate/ureidoglycolate dehydrogenase [Burkholderiales bacterium]MDE2395481.1 malate/lactate/ureidoglycolate dehydrogenase [Burkholderiales bacterium]MDE2456954.1 malate/lactate/ureidoglycolate dehydrogenase [Burkholderiales bacterium]